MPKVTLTVSYEDEEFGRGESKTYSRELDDLDPYDLLWFYQEGALIMCFDCEQLQMISSQGYIYKTDL